MKAKAESDKTFEEHIAETNSPRKYPYLNALDSIWYHGTYTAGHYWKNFDSKTSAIEKHEEFVKNRSFYGNRA